PTGVQFGHDAPKTHSLVSADSLQDLRRSQRSGSVAPQDFEVGLPVEWRGHRRAVAEFSRAPVCQFYQLARAFDVPELPGRQGKEGHRYSADAVAKTLQHLQVPLGLA